MTFRTSKKSKDPQFLAELEKRKFDLDPASGEELEKIVRGALSQPPESRQLKKLLGG